MPQTIAHAEMTKSRKIIDERNNDNADFGTGCLHGKQAIWYIVMI